MFETIVWATDGSDAADHALPYLHGLAQAHGATFTLRNAGPGLEIAVRFALPPSR